jgi:hypothetical protein
MADHLKKDKFLPRVRVIETFVDDDVNTFDLSDELIIPQMTKWCEENECGYRTSYDTFKFRNQEQLTMFILRWS